MNPQQSSSEKSSDSPKGRRLRVVVFAPEKVSERPAGPNIRAIALARELATRFDVTLAAPNETNLLKNEPFKTRVWTRHGSGAWLSDYDVAISQGMQYSVLGSLKAARRGVVQVFDFYTPTLLEQHAARKAFLFSDRWRLRFLKRLTRLLLSRADYVLCASERQRDLWVGAMYASGCLHEKRDSLNMDDYIAVVPFGHDSEPPRKTQPVLKGVKPGIGVHDKLLLWGGGLWDWFDPETLLRAMEGLKDSRPDIKLLFMGVHPPDRDGGPPAMALRVMELAEKSGLMDRTVFFNKDWVPFDKRADYLLESDLAVCVSPGSLENAYSFRTRLVDALWAGLPIVCTRGGSMADFVELHDVGLCTRPGDADQLRDCLLRALEPDAQSRFRANIGLCQRLLRWDKCAEPLVEFCQKVEDGRFQPRREPAWLPILQYAYYKITSQAEKILEILSGN